MATLALNASANPTVSMMPSYSQNLGYANAALNEPIQVWGRVSGGSGSYTTYQIDFGDGTPVATGNVDNTLNQYPITSPNRDFLKADHTYTSTGSKTVTLTVSDSDGATTSSTAVIRVFLVPSHEERVNMAIEKGLIFLYRDQQRYDQAGVEVSHWGTGEWGNGTTGAALMSFAENGHLATSDPVASVYADTVRRACYHTVTRGRDMAIGEQPGGTPDINANGRGIFYDDGNAYPHGFLTTGLIYAFPDAASALATPIPPETWIGGGIPPGNFRDFVQDALDQLYYCQADSGSMGWHYSTTEASSGGGAFDGSTHQWPSIAMITAEERWGNVPPEWVVTNSVNCFKQLTAEGGPLDGGVGYGSNGQWRNSAKTGGALVGFYLGGKRVDADPDASRALGFITRNWYSPITGGTWQDNGAWFAEFYAMYGVKKGLQLQGVTTITTADGVAHNWYREMSGWLLGNNALVPASIGADYRNNSQGFGQLSEGNWSTQQWPITHGSPSLQTAHAILILTQAVTIPLPVAVIGSIPDQSSRFPSPFQLQGSGSYHQNPIVPLVEYLWDWDASDGVDWSEPDASGATPSVNPGWITNGPRTVSLRVKDNQEPANSATTTAIVNVTSADVAPVALPMSPLQFPQIYSGPLGSVISLDGSASYDVDGDAIESYSWDLNGDGLYGTPADVALDTSGNNASASLASVVFSSPNNSQVGLKVCSTPRNAQGAALGPQQSGTSSRPVDVYASITDLSVSAFSATNLNPGISADLDVTLSSAAGSAAANAVVVRFYNGNPFTSGVQIGSSYPVNIPSGGSVTLPLPGFALGGTSLLFVFVDANNLVVESNEANNTANVNVGNRPPVAVAQNVEVAADGGNCQAMVTPEMVNNGSSDPDNDTLTFTLSPAGPFSLGSNPVTLSVSDGFLTATATATVTVVDHTPPTLSGQGVDATIECPTEPVFTAPTALDSCDANPIVSVVSDVSTPGACLGSYSRTITWKARDAAGNESESVSQTITVVDTTAPVISGQGADAAIESPGAPVFTAPTALDSCDADPVVSVVSDVTIPGVSAGVYRRTVTWKATDCAGNESAPVSQTIAVVDTTKPLINCPPDLVVVSDASSCQATKVNLGVALATDISGEPIVANDHASTTYPVGDTLVTWTATDTEGNIAFCVQKVTVLSSVSVTFLPPLAGQPVGNKLRVGQAIPHKVILSNCSGLNVTAGVTVKFRVLGMDSATGPIFQDVIEKAKGQGIDGTAGSDGRMVLTDGQWQFNLDTSNFSDKLTINGPRYYLSTVTVIDNATLKVLGSGSVNLETAK